MNIQEACTKRINEHRAQYLAQQRANELERKARNIRERYAADLIRAWIARVYSLDIGLSMMAVKEQNRQDNGGVYELTIAFDDKGNCVEATRSFEVRDGNAFPIPYKYDAPERGKFAEFWKATRDNYLMKYDDLIDAIIYATDAESSAPDIPEQELDEMFPAIAVDRFDESLEAASEMDVLSHQAQRGG